MVSLAQISNLVPDFIEVCKGAEAIQRILANHSQSLGASSAPNLIEDGGDQIIERAQNNIALMIEQNSKIKEIIQNKSAAVLLWNIFKIWPEIETLKNLCAQLAKDWKTVEIKGRKSRLAVQAIFDILTLSLKLEEAAEIKLIADELQAKINAYDMSASALLPEAEISAADSNNFLDKTLSDSSPSGSDLQSEHSVLALDIRVEEPVSSEKDAFDLNPASVTEASDSIESFDHVFGFFGNWDNFLQGSFDFMSKALGLDYIIEELRIGLVEVVLESDWRDESVGSIEDLSRRHELIESILPQEGGEKRILCAEILSDTQKILNGSEQSSLSQGDELENIDQKLMALKICASSSESLPRQGFWRSVYLVLSLIWDAIKRIFSNQRLEITVENSEPKDAAHRNGGVFHFGLFKSNDLSLEKPQTELDEKSNFSPDGFKA